MVGAAVSLLFHLALFFLIVRGTVDQFLKYEARGAPGLLPGGGGGGGGGGRGSRYISLPPLPPSRATDVARQSAVPPPEVVQPIPQPVPPEPTPVVVAAPKDTQPVASAAQPGNAPGVGPGSGGGTGGGSGGGVGPGTGPGTGPGSGGGGAGGTGREPAWSYGTFFLEKPPKELRGQTLRATFHVLADGRVASVETEPDIKDGAFAKQFQERALAFRFRPALNAEGVAVPSVATMNITLPSK